jgi:HAD superfamily hydrolase (TIGR01509 family)
LNRHISSILFDVGGVLVRLDGVLALSRLIDGRHTPDEIQQLWASSPSVIAHETGKISAHEFAIGAVEDLRLKVTPKEFLADFENWVSRPFPGTFELLKALPRGLTVAALSNTSAVHWGKITGLGLADKFDRTLLSHEIGHLKPDVAPFQIALDALRYPPSEIIFLDDSSQNIETALSLGFRAHQVTSALHAREVLFNYGVVSNDRKKIPPGSRLLESSVTRKS